MVWSTSVLGIPGHRAHTHCVCSSALTPSSARSALVGPRDLVGTQPLLTINQPVTASSMVWLRLWTAAVCTAAIPHSFVQFVQSIDDFFVPSVFICFTVTIFLIMTCYQLHATFSGSKWCLGCNTQALRKHLQTVESVHFLEGRTTFCTVCINCINCINCTVPSQY